ncbi:uncharacterized protein [Pseudochaenichthys georgianus]|uniref:uncharacterized protein n=1 Tax=Pseudochaenichthys georgianus TaxID=52239 RepID=UPI00146D3AD6|nr:uncharacterized protein LOC117459423 [Pseudochaenichthys georgianus]
MQTNFGLVQLRNPSALRSKDLTPAEFALAFSLYRNVIYLVYPTRRTELDKYLLIELDMALRFGGSECNGGPVLGKPHAHHSNSSMMVESALLKKPGGDDVLEEYKSENSLKHSTRRQLVNILASHMTEMHGRIPSRKQKKYALGIISLFPSLKDPFSRKGYLTQNFLLLFGTETACKMFEKWDTAFKIKIIKEAKHLTQSTELCRLLNAAETLAENATAGQKRTKISPSDAVDKMVHFHKTCCSINEHLRGRKGQQPYILAAGRTRNRIDTFYIVIDKPLIPCQATSSLGAFDELFKSHYVFNLSYEESLVPLYTFVQTTVYNIDINTTDESPRIRELRAKLLN